MLLDAASLYFRAYYGVPESVTAPDGTPVNAVRGFCDMVARLLADRRPTRLVACLDPVADASLAARKRSSNSPSLSPRLVCSAASFLTWCSTSGIST